jgi:hypothetical protein
MIDPARGLFDSFDSWASLERLIDNGESEGPYLECKTATGIHLQPGHRTHLAQALSGFSNTAGGVVIWGISTTTHAHSGLDVLTQIEPVGNCKSFRQQINLAMPTLAYPPVEGCVTKTLHPTAGATKGVVLAYIPKTPGDPVQALGEKKFYLRSGADFVEMPYEILKRMFAGTAGPDLVPVFDKRVVRNEGAGVWRIPILLNNRSSAVAEHTQVNVTFTNPGAFETATAADGMFDMSSVNPGKTMFGSKTEGPIYRGLGQVMGSLLVKMKSGKRPRRVLKLSITVFSSRMRARQWEMTIQLASKGLSVKKTQDKFLY